MTTEEELYKALKSYCILLGWVEFDEATKQRGEITAESEVVDWKVLDYDQESAIECLEAKFPNIDKSTIVKVVKENIKQTDSK